MHWLFKTTYHILVKQSFASIIVCRAHNLSYWVISAFIYSVTDPLIVVNALGSFNSNFVNILDTEFDKIVILI